MDTPPKRALRLSVSVGGIQNAWRGSLTGLSSKSGKTTTNKKIMIYQIHGPPPNVFKHLLARF